ncbi:hypothetical protein GGU10DRAFT_383910 [Lentinula aff. detonsa]|uniref:Carbohydrate-binding module family 19 domain-containing protein n=1 Tax=Lentinula aff. detonsa TaxID=2804958 RepID=A0AA38NRB7_9AGAR|nr:hypothetical protein GGU10DRAFT_383910 [Lentinula aff. detonsa]
MRSTFVVLTLGLAASARPMRRDATALKNGQDAITLNAQYQTLTAASSCTIGDNACVTGKFAQCVNGKFVLQSCATGTICAAIPLDSPNTGTLTTCTTQSDLDSRLAATGATSSSSSVSSSSSSSSSTTASSSLSSSSATGNSSASGSATDNSSSSGNAATASGVSTTTGTTGTTDNSASGSAVTASNSTSTSTSSGSTGSTSTVTAIGSLSSADITTNATENNPDAQSSLTLDPQVIATGFLNNDVQEAGQVASLTSNNNFINYCLTQGDLPITSGKQITTGSCNPAPIGTIPSVQNMPSAKFSNPANGATIPADTAFTITMNINNLDTGNFVNANENYFAAPQQLNAQGQIIGHTHVVIEALSDLAQTTPTNPQQFAFFKGVNTAAVNGAVTADVTSGVPAGAYRLCSINSSSNHQPVIVPIAQHGSLDDCVYFTATNGGTASNATAAAGTAATGAAATASNATVAVGAGKGKGKRSIFSRL